MDSQTCKLSGKNSYETEAQALSAAVRNVGRFNTVRLRVYKCGYCFKWHLTSKKGR